MKIGFTTAFVCAFIFLNAQIYFNNRYDYYGKADGATNIIEISTGYIVTGNTSVSASEIRIGLLNIDNQGVEKKKIGYGEKKYIHGAGFSGALQQVKPFYYLAEGLKDTLQEIDAILLKFDENLDTLLFKRYTYQGYNVFRQCKPTEDGGLIIVGETDSTGSNNQIWLVKVDSIGNVQWEKHYGGSKFEAGFSVDLTLDGGYIVGGYTESYGSGESDDYIIKVDSVGNVQWSRTYGSKYRDGAPYILQLEDSTYIAATIIGKFEYQNFYLNSRFRVMHLDKIGNILWSKEYGQSGYGETAFGIHKLKNGDYVIPGQRGGLSSLDGIKGTLLKINSQGDSLWYREYEYNPCNDNDDYIRDMKPTSDGGFIMAGFFHLSPTQCPGDTGTQDMWVIKLDSIGCPYPHCDTVTGVISLFPEVVEVKVYPNPAKNHLIVEYNLNNNQEGGYLHLYNLMGHQVLQHELKGNQGKTQLDINTVNSGVYFYLITVNNTTIARDKLVIIK